eukprot:12932666-Prorocentrum_lima.AAC.1
MIHEAFIHGLSGQLEDAIVPLISPPGELVQCASSGHAGVGETRTRSPTPHRVLHRGCCRPHQTKSSRPFTELKRV